MRVSGLDAMTHLRCARRALEPLKLQGSEPSWDFPREEMEARMEVVKWHIQQAREILKALGIREA